jgi:hypothetical protein
MGSLRSVAAIAGVGETTYSKNSGMSESMLQMTAVKRCLDAAKLIAVSGYGDFGDGSLMILGAG